MLTGRGLNERRLFWIAEPTANHQIKGAKPTAGSEALMAVREHYGLLEQSDQ